jgi:hypothetical protein
VQLCGCVLGVVTAVKEGFENVVEGMCKVVMAVVRLILALPKIFGCWELDASRAAFTAWSAAMSGTDCEALNTLKKIDVRIARVLCEVCVLGVV